MKGWIRLGRILLAGAALGLAMKASPASAEVPYGTQIYDLKGAGYEAQSAYLPDHFYRGDLKAPEDLFIDSKDHLYIADTGNNRIVHLDENDRLVRTIEAKQGEGKLNEPNGVFVRKDGTIYVADTKNERIAVFQEDGTFLTSYRKPDTPLLPKDFVYQPTKVAVDDRGYLYVAVRNGYQGLLLLDPEGQFDGFFGANRVDFTLTDSLKRLFYTKEQLQKELLKLPGSVSNVTRGPDGFVYTTSVSVKKGHIKKLNYDGKDLLGEKVYGSKNLKAQQQNQFTDITVDSRGYLTAIEAQFGTVYQYNSQGDLLFSFGAKDEGYQKLGLFKSPSSIAVNSKGVLYVLDRGSHLLQAFKATDFANKIHDAMDLYIQGQYEKGAGLWSEVLHLNTKYYRAHLGLAKAYYKQGRYEQAMNEYRMAGDVKGYSDAFWQVRLNWMQRHFTTLAGSLAAGIVILWLASRMAKRAAERRGSVEPVEHPA